VTPPEFGRDAMLRSPFEMSDQSAA